MFPKNKIDHGLPSPYHRRVKGLILDVYDVLNHWGGIHPSLDHVIKKALGGGNRGHKDILKDVDEMIWSLQRMKEDLLAEQQETFTFVTRAPSRNLTPDERNYFEVKTT